MPRFTKHRNHYVVAYVTGPAHVYLGVAFGDAGREPAMIRKPAIGSLRHPELDEAKIRDAVLQGLARAHSELGVSLFATEIVYVADDSQRYDLFAYCAYLLAERVGRSGIFEEVSASSEKPA